MKNIIEFKYFTGKTIISPQNKEIFEEMNIIAYSHEFLIQEDILQYITPESELLCMYKDNKLAAFSWIETDKQKQIAELCWFVINKKLIKGLESKKLLNKILDHCKQDNIKSLKFNCAEQSWFRIKDKNSLFKNFGYNVTENEQEYDVSIDI